MATTTLCAAAIRLRLLGLERPRIGEPLVVALDLIEVADVLGRRDDRGDRAVVLGGRPEIDDLDAIRAGGDELDVFLYRVRRREVPVGAHPEAEMRFGCRDATAACC